MNPGTILPCGFAGGYEMETLPGFGLAGEATNTMPGAWGAEYAKVIEMYDHFAGMWLVGEDLPQATMVLPFTRRKKISTGCQFRWSTSRTTQMTSRCATMLTRRVRLLLPVTRRQPSVRVAAVPQYSQHGYLPSERKAAGWRLQQIWPDPRHSEPVHLRRQPVHQRRG